MMKLWNQAKRGALALDSSGSSRAANSTAPGRQYAVRERREGQTDLSEGEGRDGPHKEEGLDVCTRCQLWSAGNTGEGCVPTRQVAMR